VTSAIVSFKTDTGCSGEPIDYEYGAFDPETFAPNGPDASVICQVRTAGSGFGVALLVQRDGGEWGLTITGTVENGKSDQPLKVTTTRNGSPSTPIDRGACTASLVEPAGPGHVWLSIACPASGSSICAMHGQIRVVSCAT
jgi:hypothetical protein